MSNLTATAFRAVLDEQATVPLETKVVTVRVGDRGTTATPLRPGGIVTITDVRHPARCQSGFIEAGTEVVVLNGDNLGLIVCLVGQIASLAELPRCGQIVYSSFGKKVQMAGQESERQLAFERQQLVYRSLAFGSACGLVCSLIAVSQLWNSWLLTAPGHRYSVAASVLVVSIFWGAIVGRCLFAAFEQIEHHPRPTLTIVATLVTLCGTTAAWILILPQRGLFASLVTALSATVLLGAALPALAMLGEWKSGPPTGGDSAVSGGNATDV